MADRLERAENLVTDMLAHIFLSELEGTTKQEMWDELVRKAEGALMREADLVKDKEKYG